MCYLAAAHLVPGLPSLLDCIVVPAAFDIRPCKKFIGGD